MSITPRTAIELPAPAASEPSRQDILRAVRGAAAASHTPFSTLVSIAAAESGFKADAKNKASSATGPFQITAQTWLQLVKRYGAAAGRPDLAALVHQDAGGKLSVDPEDKATVLDARHDFDLSSKLAAKLCDECRTGLAHKLGRQPSEEEVRVAYFLGVNGATRLMTAAADSPGTTMASLLPRAFSNHRSMFSEGGKSVSAEQALAGLQERYATESARTHGLKSYAGAQALVAAAAPAAAQPADAAEPKFDQWAYVQDSIEQDAAAAPQPAVQLADAAPPAPAPAPAATQTAAEDLACKPEKDGGVTCLLPPLG